MPPSRTDQAISLNPNLTGPGRGRHHTADTESLTFGLHERWNNAITWVRYSSVLEHRVTLVYATLTVDRQNTFGDLVAPRHDPRTFKILLVAQEADDATELLYRLATAVRGHPTSYPSMIRCQPQSRRHGNRATTLKDLYILAMLLESLPSATADDKQWLATLRVPK